MTANDQAEMRRLKKELQRVTDELRFFHKRLPGLNTIEKLEQDAYLMEALSPEAAANARRLAARLDEMRAHVYGPRKGYKRDPELV